MALVMDPGAAESNNPPPRDTNRLKDIAVAYPHLIISGSPTYWILDHGTAAARAVQIDFIDAAWFWKPLHTADMTVQPAQMPFRSLTLPTLVVSKIRAAAERNHSTLSLRIAKQNADMRDFDFAVGGCLASNQTLLDFHLEQIAKEEVHRLQAIGAFWRVAGMLVHERQLIVQQKEAMKKKWRQLLVNSKVTLTHVDGV